MIEKKNIAVIGVGYLGNYHAEKYSKLPFVNLAAVSDIRETRAKEIAAHYHTKYYLDYQKLLEKETLDAVSIAVPTDYHYEIAKVCLEKGIDVLIEKPITHQLWQAKALVELAQAKNKILQVGHVERFNSAIQKATTIITHPLFIECHRLHPFTERGTEVDVVLDLMIHDLDIILSFVRSPVSKINAVGVSVISHLTDIANVRLEFENGCVANVTSSRISFKSMRKIRLFQPDGYVSLDFQTTSLDIYKKTLKEGENLPEIEVETLSLERKDALQEEINSFLHSVQYRTKPLVSGDEALEALRLAKAINANIKISTRKYYSHPLHQQPRVTDPTL